jgi:hypothetical protein
LPELSLDLLACAGFSEAAKLGPKERRRPAKNHAPVWLFSAEQLLLCIFSDVLLYIQSTIAIAHPANQAGSVNLSLRSSRVRAVACVRLTASD